MGDLRYLRVSVDEWLREAQEALQTEYPQATVRVQSHDTDAFALRAGLSVTTGDPAEADEDVVISVDVKRNDPRVDADVALGTGEVLAHHQEAALNAAAVTRIRAFLDSAVKLARRELG